MFAHRPRRTDVAATNKVHPTYLKSSSSCCSASSPDQGPRRLSWSIKEIRRAHALLPFPLHQAEARGAQPQGICLHNAAACQRYACSTTDSETRLSIDQSPGVWSCAPDERSLDGERHSTTMCLAPMSGLRETERLGLRLTTRPRSPCEIGHDIQQLPSSGYPVGSPAPGSAQSFDRLPGAYTPQRRLLSVATSTWSCTTPSVLHVAEMLHGM